MQWGLTPSVAKVLRDESQIVDETAIVLFSLSRVGPSQNGGWMRRYEDGLGQRRAEGAAPEFIQAYALAEDRLGGGDPQTQHDACFQRLDFRFEPRAARGDFRGRWFFVLAAFALRFPFEVFDGVGDVDIPADDTGLFQCPVEEMSGRSHEGMAGQILLIARLFADKQQLGPRRPFAEHRLRGLFIEVTAHAGRRRLLQIGKRQFGGEEGGGR